MPSAFDCWNDIPHLCKPIPTPRKQNNLILKRGKEGESKTKETTCSSKTHLSAIPLNIINTCEENESPQHGECLSKKLALTTLEEKYNELLKNYTSLKKANSKLEKTVEELTFSVDSISEDNIQFYTGFPNKQVFENVLEYLNPGENGENIVNVRSQGTPTSNEKSEQDLVNTSGYQKVGRPKKLKPRNEFFLFLCRVRVGLLETDLAQRFNISVSSVSNIIISWANFVYLRLGTIDIWPTRETINKTMPISFCEKYPSTRVIIDATEIKVEMPSSLVLQSQTYSNYKSTNTLKGLIGISPSGNITFISQLYTGGISDSELTERCGILNLPFAPNDSVMADKGFDIQHLLEPINVKLNIPPFLKMKSQMSPEEVAKTQQMLQREFMWKGQ